MNNYQPGASESEDSIIHPDGRYTTYTNPSGMASAYDYAPTYHPSPFETNSNLDYIASLPPMRISHSTHSPPPTSQYAAPHPPYQPSFSQAPPPVASPSQPWTGDMWGQQPHSFSPMPPEPSYPPARSDTTSSPNADPRVYGAGASNFPSASSSRRPDERYPRSPDSKGKDREMSSTSAERTPRGDQPTSPIDFSKVVYLNNVVFCVFSDARYL